MHLFKLDTFIYNFYKQKWNLEEDDNTIPTFCPPKTWKMKFLKRLGDFNQGPEEQVELSNKPTDELVIYQYPTHYKHMNIFQYDFGFMLYFSLVGSFILVKALADLRKKKYKSGGFFSFMAGFTFLEGWVISSRVKDVKIITLKNGNTLCVKTFQDGDMEYRMDIKEFRVVNKEIEKLIILIDANMARNKNFQFFFIEPTPATVYNPDLFQTVLVDKRYLKYLTEYKKL
jgi:hypothetical protein